METDSSSESDSISEMEIKIETSEDNKTSSEDARYSYSDIATYLSSGTYPAGADKPTKCSLRKRSKFFVMEGGHIHYIAGKIKKKPRLVVLDEDEQQRLIKTIHDTAQLGRDKTLSQLNERYYWPDMYKQVCAYVHIQSCDNCQRQNQKMKKTSATLHPIPVTVDRGGSRIFERFLALAFM